MALEIFRPLENDDFGKGLILQEYQGSYYLISASRSRNGGTVYKRWGYPQNKNKKPIDQALPWQVKIGDSRKEAVEMLYHFVEQLSGNVKSPESDDIPW